jgi:hypothetical protein
MRTARNAAIFSTCLLLALAPGRDAAAQTTEFDGFWDVTLTCPPFNEEDDEANGYVHKWQAEIKNGALRGVYGTIGHAGYHLLTGTVAANGRADLKLEGIVSSPGHAINNAYRGKPYSYKVRADFEPAKGTGRRIGKRNCDFAFVPQK